MSDFEMPFEPEKKKKSGPSYTWQEVWWAVLSKPSVETFDEILRDTTATPTRAYRWIFITTMLGYAGSMIILLITLSGLYPSSAMGSILFNLLCVVLLSGIIGVIGLAISAGIEHVFVQFFGGRGEYSQLVYAMAAYTAPMIFVNLIVSMIFTQSPVSMNILSLALGIYNIVLNVQALRSVYRVGIGPALGAIFLPGFIFGCACFFLIVTVLGPSITQVYSNLPY